MPFDCPSCKAVTPKLIGYTDPPRVGCPNCGTQRPRFSNCNLGQVVDTYVKKDGSIGKRTVGKDWEIGNRTISRDDNFTVVNKATGKEAEY